MTRKQSELAQSGGGGREGKEGEESIRLQLSCNLSPFPLSRIFDLFKKSRAGRVQYLHFYRALDIGPSVTAVG